jgi:hypothetical protein
MVVSGLVIDGQSGQVFRMRMKGMGRCGKIAGGIGWRG